jgi:hypothetical protein
MQIVSAAHRALWAALLWTGLIATGRTAAPVPPTALVSVADGPPFSLIRGARAFTATRSVTLVPGDIIQTQPSNLLILEFRNGSQVTALVGIGPSSQVYWLERADHVSLAVRTGWIKVDTLTMAQSARVEAQGLRLGASSASGIYLLHAGPVADELFDEQGTVSMHERRSGGDEIVATGKPNQLMRRADIGASRSQIGVDDPFVAAMPAPFRDPLPSGMGAQLRAGREPQLVRPVTFTDVGEWLSAPRSWRAGFIERFRVRLSDPAFFKSVDATMPSHPEWQAVLHPPPKAP